MTTTMMDIAVPAITGLLGVLLGWLFAQIAATRLRTLAANADARSAALEQQGLRFRARELADATAHAALTAQIEEQRAQTGTLESELRRQLGEAQQAAAAERHKAESLLHSQAETRIHLEAERRALQERITLFEQTYERTTSLEARLHAAAEELLSLKQELGLSREQNRAAQERLVAQQSWITEQSRALKAQFGEIAGQLLAENSTALRQTNNTAIDGLIAPLRQQLAEFHARVDEVHDLESRDRAGLSQLLEGIGKTQQQLSAHTDTLSRALASKPGAAAALGSMRLELQLQAGGLEEGTHYVRQAGGPDQGSSAQRPPVAIRLPDRGGYLAVDTGFNLSPWEEAAAADGEAQRTAALSRHLEALRQHIDELGARRYAELADGEKPVPFTLMYLPVEGAALVALERDPELFGHAHRQNVVLATPATLFLIVGAIGHLWRVASREMRARTLAAEAGQLLRSLDQFLAGFDQLGQAVGSAHRLFGEADARLRSGDNNALAVAQRMKALGAAAGDAGQS